MKETDVKSISVSPDNQMIAVGDSKGCPRILSYPAFNHDQDSLKLANVHTRGVSNVLFLTSKLLVTIGLHDQTTIVWEYHDPKEEANINLRIEKEIEKDSLSQGSRNEEDDVVLLTFEDETLMI